MDNLQEFLRDALESRKDNEKYYSKLKEILDVCDVKYHKLVKVLMLLHGDNNMDTLSRMMVGQDATYEYDVLFRGLDRNNLHNNYDININLYYRNIKHKSHQQRENIDSQTNLIILVG
ncbi:Hypothetical protein ORPV_578 [Orpheovirus IHUMI-LCC2]|uniref:Uncharacterized protein n=1 Tax=Orpheovirus IHUMI-LCC2 TaxID=2023057 RepID=A0A2I2L4K8_9VIRU|nr:Hypothetical protein ORPV_578 [Orpheovirus IHUMI-LCC2]SNW62482.1 Hypothetical protein ORPV_578 [Orpheovirus IHUMI-LCC2]